MECSSCYGTDFDEDPHAGFTACKNCGVAFLGVGNISMEAEYRVFNDDEASKDSIRAGPGHNFLSFEKVDLSTKSIKPHLDSNDQEFYNAIVKKIWEVLDTLYQGDANKIVGYLAIEKAHFAVLVQSLQKLGKIPMIKSKSLIGMGSEEYTPVNVKSCPYARQKYACKNKIVVYALMMAFMEEGINKFSVHEINDSIRPPVPKYLVCQFRDKMDTYMREYPHLLK